MGWHLYTYSYDRIFEGYSLLGVSRSASVSEICRSFLEHSMAEEKDEAEPSEVQSPVLLTCEGKSVESWNRAFRGPNVVYADYSYVPSSGEVVRRVGILANEFERISH